MSAAALSPDAATDGESGLPNAKHALRHIADALNIEVDAQFLLLVEDPGAANFAAGLVPHLKKLGRVSIYANGTGARQLARLGCEASPLDHPFDASGLLASVCPSLVIVGTSEDADAAAHGLVAACRKNSLPTLGIVDGPANAGRRFLGTGPSVLAFAPDWLFVPCHRMKAEFEKAGFDASRTLVVAHPHFEKVKGARDVLEREGRDAVRNRLFPEAGDSSILVFLAELSDGLDPSDFRRMADYTLYGRGGDDRRTNIVLEEVLDALRAIEPRPYVVLRLHPKNSEHEFAAYSGEIDAVSYDGSAFDVVYAADLVVGLTTILLSEAAVLGRPILCVVPRASEREWLLDPPGIELAWTCDRGELLLKLRGALENPCRQTVVTRP